MADTRHAQSQGLALLNQVVADVGPVFAIAQAQARVAELGIPDPHQANLLQGECYLQRVGSRQQLDHA